MWSLMDRMVKKKWLAYCSLLHESIAHADNTAVCFGIKVCFENWK